MHRFFVRQAIQSVVDRLAFKGDPDGVPVDRDYVRTTLIECELEVRDVHRMLDAMPQLDCHRPNTPSSRY